MLLDKGVVHTLAGAAPPVSSLAISGERVAAGDGAGERVDLGGLCVIPGLADAHVHFPTWSMAQRELQSRRGSGQSWSWLVALLVGVAIGYILRHFGVLPPAAFELPRF